MLCSPKQLIPQKNSQTSAGMATKKIVLDRESGKTLVIQYPFFDLMMSDSSLSFRTDLHRLPQTKLIALLKCLLILQSLPEVALEEAAGELKGIADFYADRAPQESLSILPASAIRGKLISAKIRPPIVLEP